MPDPTSPAKPPLSRLAVFALVLAVVPACPPVNLAGAFAGMLAWRRIRQAPHRVGGRRVAKVAVFGGWISSIVWTTLWWWVGAIVQDHLQESMIEAVTATVTHAAARPESVRSMHWMTERVEPTGESLAAFAESTQRRYGAVERVSITSLTSGGTVGRPTYMTALTLYFDGRHQRLGSAHFQTVPGTMRVRLTRLAIIDREAGDLVIGEAPSP